MFLVPPQSLGPIMSLQRYGNLRKALNKDPVLVEVDQSSNKHLLGERHTEGVKIWDGTGPLKILVGDKKEAKDCYGLPSPNENRNLQTECAKAPTLEDFSDQPTS